MALTRAWRVQWLLGRQASHSLTQSCATSAGPVREVHKGGASADGIGFCTLYSDTYKCLMRHGTIVHSQQVEWTTDAKLVVFPDIFQLRLLWRWSVRCKRRAQVWICLLSGHVWPRRRPTLPTRRTAVKGEKTGYRRSDLLCDQHHCWLVYDLLAGDLGEHRTRRGQRGRSDKL